ncbi:MAG: GspE/PulE family protein, partial [Dictyoglomus sp.]
DIRLLTGFSVEPYLLKYSEVSEELELKPKKEIIKEENIGVKALEEDIAKIIEELAPKGGILEAGTISDLSSENVVDSVEIELLSEKNIETQDESVQTFEIKQEPINEVLSQIEEIEIVEESQEVSLEESKSDTLKKSDKDLASKIIESVKSSLSSSEKTTLDEKRATRRTTQRPSGRRKLLGETLLEKKIITKEQLDEALSLSSKKGIRLGEALLELKLIDDYQLAQILSEQLGIPYRSLRDIKVDVNLAKIIPPQKARDNLVLPLYRENGKIIVGMVDPSNILILDDLRVITKSDVIPIIVPRNELVDAINQIWGSEEVEKVLEEIIVQKEEEETQYQEVSLEEISSQEGPIAKLVNSILADAVKRGASDIHIEPTEKNVRVRFRIDGILHEIMFVQKRFQAAIVSRIKIMSDMDISERRIPQDGRIKAKIGGEVYDFRVSTLPGVFG